MKNVYSIDKPLLMQKKDNLTLRQITSEMNTINLSSGTLGLDNIII